MDVDIDGWTRAFPLPFRALLLVGVGVLAWATNLHGLHRLRIDAAAALDLRTPTPLPAAHDHLPPHALYAPVYRLFASYASWCFVCWLAFYALSRGDPVRVDVYGWIPAFCALGVVLALFAPANILERNERERFVRALRRTIFPPAPKYHNAPRIHFSDVVLADILTSFAKVFVDVYFCICQLLAPGGSLLFIPAQSGWTRWIAPSIMSIPYIIRFRQCLVEYAGDTSHAKPLYNAFKYFSSFPVLFLSAAQPLIAASEKGREIEHETWHGEHLLFRLWLLAAVFNSLYSYWWDVTNDWGFALLKPSPPPDPTSRLPRRLVLPHLHSGVPLIDSDGRSRSPEDHRHYGHARTPSAGHRRTQSIPAAAAAWLTPRLRPTLLLPQPQLTYGALLFVNLVLRLSWSAKLSPHLHRALDGGTHTRFGDALGMGLWVLELAEIVRRWLWVFVRVEWELVRRGDSPSGGSVREDPGLLEAEEYGESALDRLRVEGPELRHSARDDEGSTESSEFELVPAPRKPL
ncbi:EXS family-domain-containing protein [Schizophyllum amplum]|uniref:EXS family-domain-containing protein n=1 Tax=Schizophyllum amplum TaxID=97359 RepID=A0A550CX89_9AGAR|nr:EXS family-domain-containing protein [Auriculariopsis ampla]